MKRLCLLLPLYLLLIPFDARSQGQVLPPAEPAIRAVLAAQAAAWNRADIEGYMVAGYWQSDSLLFIGQNGPTYGFNATLTRYRQRYPDAAHMGQLAFAVQQIRLLSPRSAFVVGRWELKRPQATDAAGYFTLLFERRNNRWVIVADHSS